MVLDEIHKDRRWKSKLKGLYDAAPSPVPLIVTGSARLDLARRGADSLLGRYLPYRLHGFTTGEGAHPPAPDAWQPGGDPRFPWEDLLRLGGFPEPLLGGAEGQALRWSRLRLERIALEDSRDLMNISDPQALMNLLELLPSRIGSLLSVRSLHEDVGKAYATGHDSPPRGHTRDREVSDGDQSSAPQEVSLVECGDALLWRCSVPREKAQSPKVTAPAGPGRIG